MITGDLKAALGSDWTKPFAGEKAKAAGAEWTRKGQVTRNTTILVVGPSPDTPTNPERKADKLIDEGYDIKKMTPEQFRDRCEGNT